MIFYNVHNCISTAAMIHLVYSTWDINRQLKDKCRQILCRGMVMADYVVPPSFSFRFKMSNYNYNIYSGSNNYLIPC